MASEVRQITLTTEELTAAIDGYRRMTPGFLPAGKIVDCKPAGDAGLTLTVETPVGTLTQATEVVIRGLDLLKPMIRFCIENNIVLPRAGRKSVRCADGALSLCVTLDLSIDLSGELDPMRVTHIKTLTPAKSEADTFVSMT
jgi:hypothetical protein